MNIEEWEKALLEAAEKAGDSMPRNRVETFYWQATSNPDLPGGWIKRQGKATLIELEKDIPLLPQNVMAIRNAITKAFQWSQPNVQKAAMAVLAEVEVEDDLQREVPAEKIAADYIGELEFVSDVMLTYISFMDSHREEIRHLWGDKMSETIFESLDLLMEINKERLDHPEKYVLSSTEGLREDLREEHGVEIPTRMESQITAYLRGQGSRTSVPNHDPKGPNVIELPKTDRILIAHTPLYIAQAMTLQRIKNITLSKLAAFCRIMEKELQAKNTGGLKLAVDNNKSS